jgi:hypothetical protein
VAVSARAEERAGPREVERCGAFASLGGARIRMEWQRTWGRDPGAARSAPGDAVGAVRRKQRRVSTVGHVQRLCTIEPDWPWANLKQQQLGLLRAGARYCFGWASLITLFQLFHYFKASNFKKYKTQTS